MRGTLGIADEKTDALGILLWHCNVGEYAHPSPKSRPCDLAH